MEITSGYTYSIFAHTGQHKRFKAFLRVNVVHCKKYHTCRNIHNNWQEIIKAISEGKRSLSERGEHQQTRQVKHTWPCSVLIGSAEWRSSLHNKTMYLVISRNLTSAPSARADHDRLAWATLTEPASSHCCRIASSQYLNNATLSISIVSIMTLKLRLIGSSDLSPYSTIMKSVWAKFISDRFRWHHCSNKFSTMKVSTNISNCSKDLLLRQISISSA